MSQELNGTLTNSANLVGTFGTGGGGGTTNYNDLTNKPQINGVTLQGNKTTSNLNISYNDLTNKPTIPAAQVNSDWNSTSGVSEILNKPSLAAVATSGSYNDLTNTPSIPAAQVNSDWNSTSGVSEILNKPSLAAVATSGSYSDLSGTPTIPVNSDFALSGLSDTDITTPTANQVIAYDGDNWVNSDILDTKADVIPTGSHTVWGVWSNDYYSASRLFVPFPNANKYTITLTQVRYRSGANTMAVLPNASIISTNDCGFLVSSDTVITGGTFGDINFTTA